MPKACRLSVLFLWILIGCNTHATGEIRDVSFAPDGKFIAVSYAKADSCFIYKVPLDSGAAVRLTQATEGYETSPVFSADGKFLVYSYATGKSEHSHIMIAQVDGSHAHALTNGAADDFSPRLNSHDGRIYFARAQFFGHYSPIASSHYHDWDIYSIGLDGGSLKRLTNERFYEISAPALSPDGKSLIFSTMDQSGSQITIRSLETPAKPAVVLKPHVPGEPKFSPIFADATFMSDGRGIIFMAASNGKSGFDYDVYRMDLKTNSLEKLTTDNGYSTGLSLSSDGRTAAFLKARPDEQKTSTTNMLYLLDIQTHKMTPFEITGLN